MNRNVKYRSIAYGTWHIGDARKFVEERFNGKINKNAIDSHITQAKFTNKEEELPKVISRNLLTLQISSDDNPTELIMKESKDTTPITITPLNMKHNTSFDYYNQEDNLLTVSSIDIDPSEFEILKKNKKNCVNNQLSMADSGIADNSDSSAEGDWYSSNEYIQYCQKMQNTTNTEDEFSLSSQITNNKKDVQHHRSLDTIYQHSVSPSSNQLITKKKISPSIITNSNISKPLMVKSINKKHAPIPHLRTTMTSPCQILSLPHDYICCNHHHQPNNLTQYGANYICNTHFNNFLDNNCHRPYFETNSFKMANHPSKTNERQNINYFAFSVLNDPINISQHNTIISNGGYNNIQHLNPSIDDEKYQTNNTYNGIDKRRAKSVEINKPHCIILNDQGYNTMRVDNFNNISNTIGRNHPTANFYVDNSIMYKNDSSNKWKIGTLPSNEQKKEKNTSALQSTKNFFQRIFSNPVSTLPKKWKKSNIKNSCKSTETFTDDWSHMNALTTMQRYGTIHRTKTENDTILDPKRYCDNISKQYQSHINVCNNSHPYSFTGKELRNFSYNNDSSQKSPSDSCYTTTDSTSGRTDGSDKTMYDVFKEKSYELKEKNKEYPSIEDFKSWDEIYKHLKSELLQIREKDHRIMRNLRNTEQELNELKEILL
uniref:Homeobox domain-containing protein n=1 Tax=Parastrongyloides trichosuri TaxID=131310 RepID=A0A0N4Z3C0_PARTI